MKRSWFAGAAAGTIVAALAGAAYGQDIHETVNGPSSGVTATGTGAQNVTVTITPTGNVNNPAGTGVTASAQQGNVTVTDHGLVAGAAGGILAQTLGPSASITVTGAVTAGTADAVEALGESAGAASVKVGSGHSAANPLTIATSGAAGVAAVSVTGATSVKVGGNVSISAGVAGEAGVADVVALGVLRAADTGGPSAVVTVGQNATLTLNGNRGAAVSAQIGQSGIVGPANGTASVSADVANGVDINVHGLDDAGVIGFVTDVSGSGVYTGFGAVTVSVGTGTINVDEAGAEGSASGTRTNIGEGAFSAGGDVSVDNAANITVSGGLDTSIGIEALTGAAGSATITSRGSISSANGDAIRIVTGAGPASVTVNGGAITAAADGIDATSTSGDIAIVTAKSVSITADDIGIDAVTGGAGAIMVTSGGPITSLTNDGIGVTSGSGAVNVDVTGGDIVAALNGVNATSTSGAITVSTAKSTAIAAGGIGIQAESAGAVTVDAEGPVAGATGDGVFAESTGSTVAVTINGNVATGGSGDAVEAFADSAGSATVTVGSGSHGHPLTITGGPTGGVVGISLTGPVSVTAGDNVSVSAGVQGVSGTTDIGAIGLVTAADQGGVGARVVVGRNAALTLAGNNAAGITAQIGQSGRIGPTNGVASAAVTVGDGVGIDVSGFNDAGVIAFVTDLSGTPVYFGFGDASVTVGTGLINVNETGGEGAVSPFSTNIGEGAISAGGNVSISNAAYISVLGVFDVTNGLEAETAGNGTSTVVDSGDITVNNGDAIVARTQNGASTIDVEGGVLTGSDAGVNAITTGSGAVSIEVAAGASLNGAVGLMASSGSGAIGVDNAGLINDGLAATTAGAVAVTNESSGRIIGAGAANRPALNLTGGAISIDNKGFIGTQLSDHTGQILVSGTVGGTTLTNEVGGTLDGVLTGVGNLTVNNAGLWETSGLNDFGSGAGPASNLLNNTGLIQVGQNGANAAPTEAGFGDDLAAFNNGSATATGTLSMLNRHVGDTVFVTGLFNGAVGHSLLALDVQLGGPGSTADELILSGGSAGQTLIRVNDTLHGHGALNPAGIALVQGSSAAATFALDPTQPGYDPVTKGIDKGLFTYPLVFAGGTEMLVGEPGLSAHQMATMGAAAEQIWSATTPGDQSEQRLAFSLANGGDGAAPGLHVWAQALNGGPSRLNGGATMLGRASFAGDPVAAGGAPLAGVAQQSATISAYGMTYGFDTGYAQNVSALITGVDLARHVGEHDAWSWGVSTGYLESQQSFTSGASVAQYQGALAAVHGAYVNASGFYVAGDVKLTALQVSYATAWGGGAANTPNAAIDTFGGEADAGWARPLTGAWTLEPVASLSMQSSRLGALSIAGEDVRFGDASSVRLGFGAKLSGGGRLFGLSWKSESSLKLWDELHGANTLDLTSAGAGSVLPDPIGGTFTDAAESFSLRSPDGRASAFVAGAYRWKDDYQAAQVSMGFKLAW
ncbi:MAG TPA: hypothetical protein VGG29_11830 [Caulobacteraceae bacterium]|jgi:hypothetical protein